MDVPDPLDWADIWVESSRIADREVEGEVRGNKHAMDRKRARVCLCACVRVCSFHFSKFELAIAVTGPVYFLAIFQSLDSCSLGPALELDGLNVRRHHGYS